MSTHEGDHIKKKDLWWTKIGPGSKSRGALFLTNFKYFGQTLFVIVKWNELFARNFNYLAARGQFHKH